jgi:hypothetical protein
LVRFVALGDEGRPESVNGRLLTELAQISAASHQQSGRINEGGDDLLSSSLNPLVLCDQSAVPAVAATLAAAVPRQAPLAEFSVSSRLKLNVTFLIF